MRQYELALEKQWVTQDGYFRLYTTFTGFDLAEVYKVMPYVVGETPRNILELTDEVVVEMLEESEELEKNILFWLLIVVSNRDAKYLRMSQISRVFK